MEPEPQTAFFESCRAPGGYDEREQLAIAQALDEEELRLLREELRQEGIDSGRWATRIIELERAVTARAALLAASG